MSTDVDLRQLGDSLHKRLLAGDVTATAEVAEAFLHVIIAALRQRFPQLDDPHLVDTAAEDALLNYFVRPEQYDPARLPLLAYLSMAARGDLLNLLYRHKKDIGQMRLAELVELGDAKAEYGVEVQDDFDLEAEVEASLSPLWQRLRRLLPDPIDQEIVLLMMEGVRETSVYAEVLGIRDRPEDEQAATVKRQKDRLKKVIQRAIRPSELKE